MSSAPSRAVAERDVFFGTIIGLPGVAAPRFALIGVSLGAELPVRIDAAATQGLVGSMISAGNPFGLSGVSTGAAGFGPDVMISLAGNGLGPGHEILAAAYARPRVVNAGEAQRRESLKHIANAMARHAVGESDAAREMLDTIRKRDRTNPFVYQSLGQIALDRGKYQEAEQFFRRAHSLAPEYGFEADAENARILQRGDDAVFARARALVASAATRRDGIRLLVGLTNRSEENVEAHLLLGDALMRERDLVNALGRYQRALEHADTPQLQAILRRAEEMAAVAPESAVLRNLVGQAQLRLGRLDEAAASLELSSRLSGHDPAFRVAEAPAHIAIGRKQLAAGDIAAALRSFELARDRDFLGEATRIALAEGLLARAEQRFRLGSHQTAAVDYHTAVRTLDGGGDETLRSRLASGSFRAGLMLESRRLSSGAKVGDEILVFQAAFDLDPGNAAYRAKLAETRYALGDEYRAANKYKDAAHAYQRAHQLERSNAIYRASAIDAFIAWGDDRMRVFEYDRAIEAYRESYKIDTNNPIGRGKLAGAHHARGLDHLENGRISAALADFREAVRLEPGNGDYVNSLNGLS